MCQCQSSTLWAVTANHAGLVGGRLSFQNTIVLDRWNRSSLVKAVEMKRVLQANGSLFLRYQVFRVTSTIKLSQK